MSHISFSSVKIDTTRIAQHAEPAMQPSPARVVLYWHAVATVWLLAATNLWHFGELALGRGAVTVLPPDTTPARLLFSPLITAVVMLWFWWSMLRRGGIAGRSGSALLAALSGFRALAAVLVSAPLTLDHQLHVYGMVAFLAYALAGGGVRGSVGR